MTQENRYQFDFLMDMYLDVYAVEGVEAYPRRAKEHNPQLLVVWDKKPRMIVQSSEDPELYFPEKTIRMLRNQDAVIYRGYRDREDNFFCEEKVFPK